MKSRLSKRYKRRWASNVKVRKGIIWMRNERYNLLFGYMDVSVCKPWVYPWKTWNDSKFNK